MQMNVVTDSMCQVWETPNGSTIINYDNPNMRDEECTYTFNKDGSASRVSNAWGTKIELAKGTLIDIEKQQSPAKMIDQFNKSYQENKNLDIQA